MTSICSPATCRAKSQTAGIDAVTVVLRVLGTGRSCFLIVPAVFPTNAVFLAVLWIVTETPRQTERSSSAAREKNRSTRYITSCTLRCHQALLDYSNLKIYDPTILIGRPDREKLPF